MHLTSSDADNPRFSLFIFAIVLFVLSLSAVAEAACWEDSLARVDRDILVMRSGAAYQLVDDPRVVTFWLPLSQITICDKVGYADGQIVNYYEIRNADAPEIVRAVEAR